MDEFQSTPHRRYRKLYVALALLLLFSFVALPWWLEQRPQPVVEVDIKPLADSGPAPYEAAQSAKQRRHAQEILAEALNKQARLETMAVTSWGEAEFTEALAAAKNGDEFYQQHDYPRAIEHYKTFLARLTELLEASGRIHQATLEQAHGALQQPDLAAAEQGLAMVQALAPRDDKTLALEQQVAALRDIMPLSQQAREQVEANDYGQALQAIRQASAISDDFSWLREQRAAIEEAYQQQQFAEAMSRGFALLQSQPSQAAAQFRKALEFKPGADDAKGALDQALLNQKNQGLESLLKQGRQFASAERWQQAVQAYSKARQLDSHVVEAQVGLLQAQARLDLDQRLQYFIEQPLRITREQQQTRSALQDARAIGKAGPRLQQQQRQLTALLEKALAPKAVQFLSDNQTQITLYKVGKLGSFSQQTLKLKPGNYVAVGSRSGYRDVRKEFVVGLEGPTTPVEIICREQLRLGG